MTIGQKPAERTYDVVKRVLTEHLGKDAMYEHNGIVGEILSELIEAGYSVNSTYWGEEQLRERLNSAEQAVDATHVKSAIADVRAELAPLVAAVESLEGKL